MFHEYQNKENFVHFLWYPAQQIYFKMLCLKFLKYFNSLKNMFYKNNFNIIKVLILLKNILAFTNIARQQLHFCYNHVSLVN